MSTVNIPEDILRDIKEEHPDIVEFGIIREEEVNGQIKVLVEVKTSMMYIVYEYTLDSSRRRILNRNILYALPLL
ncbi:MAG: hypothetical protein GXO23_07115 [Crenarchaeota archaeon]|nr:hypothetical protein [Thermoproteota archaeon]